MFPKILVLVSKNKIKGKPKCVICLTERTFIHGTKDKYALESELEIELQFFAEVIKEYEDLLCEVQRKYWNLSSNVFKTKNGRLIMQSKCTDCGFKNSRFVKEQEAKSLLSNLGIKTPLTEILLLNVLF